MAKTKEIVFHWPNARNVLFPSELPGIERVLCARLLGVWLQADMGGGSMLITFCTFVTSERTYLHNSKRKDYRRRNYKVFLCNNYCSCTVYITCMARLSSYTVYIICMTRLSSCTVYITCMARLSSCTVCITCMAGLFECSKY